MVTCVGAIELTISVVCGDDFVEAVVDTLSVMSSIL